MRKWFILVIAILLFSAGCSTITPFEREEKMPPEIINVMIFYPAKTEKGGQVVGEPHEIPKPEQGSVAAEALRELIKGELQKDFQVIPLIPKNTKVIKVTVKDGLATANFSREILNGKAKNAREEYLGIGAIVSTLAEFEDIEKVKIQVEGREKGKINGKSIEKWWGFGGLKNQPFVLQ